MSTFYILLSAVCGLIVGLFMGFAIRKNLRSDGKLKIIRDKLDRSVYLAAEFDYPIETILSKEYIVLDVEKERN